ncbi:hypothetical protein [Lacticaseibacillus paracasei]|uniref:hypothetical protein n=1 Tax=Lacticaseibacillus paracasei TaxID=1597 RepID=UPI0004E2B319|nr:hypothetical protein [Lacticaseibacillus paracasei]QXJ68764.1 hypothetical protein J5Y16_04240 [Lacticaseibacillus paracasei subsp. paracasei]RUS40533.1 hypothetical protein IJ11_0000875 [Lacticaseibacillus paracasei]CAD7484714.1 putative membrane protein [Lacticaseibacillus paracasei]
MSYDPNLGYDPNNNFSNDYHTDLAMISATIANEKYQDRIMTLRIEIAKAPTPAIRSALQQILEDEQRKHRNQQISMLVVLIVLAAVVGIIYLYFYSSSSSSTVSSGQNPKPATQVVTSTSDSSESNSPSIDDTSHVESDTDTNGTVTETNNGDYSDNGVIKTTKTYPSNTAMRNSDTSTNGILGQWQSGNATSFGFNNDGTYTSSSNGKNTSGTWKVVYREGNIFNIQFTDSSGHNVVEPFAIDNGNLIETNLKIKWDRVN